MGGSLTNKSNWLVAATTFGIEAVYISYQWKKGRISMEDMKKRLKTSAASIIAGVVGGSVGSGVGNVIGNFILPGAGGVLGSIVGEIIGGVGVGLKTSKVMDQNSLSLAAYVKENIPKEEFNLSFEKACSVIGLSERAVNQ